MPRLTRAAAILLGSLLLFSPQAHAQDPVPQPIFDEPIGPFVVDVRGVFARFKQDAAVAAALTVEPTDLPSRGLGLVVGGHVYPLRTGSFALGLGGEILLRARGSRQVAPETEPDTEVPAPDSQTVVTRMTALSPQISLNFGKRNGWSYLSGGIGPASFTTELEDSPVGDPDTRPMAINYGGGARWFAKKHLAFSLDLRFYAIRPQDATMARPAFPRKTVMVFSAGISSK
jgi:hypothetical protein